MLIDTGTREYYKANLALFLAGFVIFATLYDYQPLFPNLVKDYGITPALASLSLSCATLSLAVALPLTGCLSDATGRRVFMGVAVICAPILALGTALSESLPALLLLRFIQGLVLAGVPAVAMAYIYEEFEPKALGAAMGLYIAGNALGGMAGRILTSWLVAWMPWRLAITVIALVSFIFGVAFVLLIPLSRNFSRQPFQLKLLARSLLGHLKAGALPWLYLIAFCCMGGFVTLYNYITFRLLGIEFNLSHTQVGFIFFAYAFGALSSGIMGILINSYGYSHILFSSLALMASGLLLTPGSSLIFVVFGIVIFTIGFFGAHSTSAAWVGNFAKQARAQASSLYLFSYYLGSSISGTVGGFIYHLWDWDGVVCLILSLTGVAAYACMRLERGYAEEKQQRRIRIAK